MLGTIAPQHSHVWVHGNGANSCCEITTCMCTLWTSILSLNYNRHLGIIERRAKESYYV